MGWDFCQTTTQTARKDYRCDACEWLLHENPFQDPRQWTKEEFAAIKLAKANGWKIKKGEKYTKTKGKWEGDFSTFKGIIAIDAICLKYNLYQV